MKINVQYRDDDFFQKPIKRRVADYKAYENPVKK